MNQFANNLKWALRALAQTPAFSLMVILILALGIGANSAVFHLVDQSLLRPLPYPDGERLVTVEGTRGDGATPVSPADFLDWRKEATRFEDLAALANASANLAGDPEPLRLQGMRVSASFLPVLGVQPALGRGFTAEEDRAGGPRVALLSHELWRSRFAGDSGLIGRSVLLGGADTTVVGILPPGFRFFTLVNDHLDFLLPMAFTEKEQQTRGFRFLSVIGRLRQPGDHRAADLELQTLSARIAARESSNRNRSARTRPLRGELVGKARTALLTLQGAVALLLLVACANLLNLMVARRIGRRGEQSIRAALGATPRDLFLQALTESALFGLLGGLFGLVLAQATATALTRLLALPEGSGLDLHQTLFTLALSLLVALALGLLPGPRPASLIQGAQTAPAGHRRTRGLLVALEMALTTTLLIAAGLMGRTLWHLRGVDPGFQAERLLQTSLTIPGGRHAALAERMAFLRQLQERCAAIPGVTSAASNDTPPFSGSRWTTSYSVAGQEAEEGRLAIAHHASPDYFRAMGIPLLEGRELDWAGNDEVVVSRAFARKHFGSASALGRQVSLNSGAGQAWQQVVGVAADVRNAGKLVESEPELYFPPSYQYRERPGDASFSLLIRTGLPAPALLPALKQALREVDPELPLGALRSMTELLDGDLREVRGRSALLAAFAGLALLLAGVGIYSVVSFLAGLRTREIGIRMALGAQRRDILGLVAGEGLRMAVAGTAAGVLGALALGRFLQAQIHGVLFWDPATLGAVLLVLVLVSLLACLLPCLRALRITPGAALREG
jgi:predicted permease